MKYLLIPFVIWAVFIHESKEEKFARGMIGMKRTTLAVEKQLRDSESLLKELQDFNSDENIAKRTAAEDKYTKEHFEKMKQASRLHRDEPL
jgi:hypothetical protein